MEATITVKSKQGSQQIKVRSGLGFQAICQKHSVGIEFSCREADCGICNFRVLAGAENLSQPTTREADFLKAMRADSDERLACQTRVMGDVTIEVDYL